jgi:hypothetical protein
MLIEVHQTMANNQPFNTVDYQRRLNKIIAGKR